MQLSMLRLARFRGFAQAEFEPQPGLNLILGANGVGKSSLLEAVHLLAYGRSFRGRVRDGLVREGAADLEVFAEWLEAGARVRRVGLRHSGREWQARLDGAPATSLAQLCAALAVVTFEPGSHELIGGGAEPRRRFLDWALFHVEQGSISLWRRYARALKQRNALLKQRAAVAHLAPWDAELAAAGEPLTQLRGFYFDRLRPIFDRTAAELLPELGQPELRFLPGWRRDELSLADALLLSRDRDLALGYTAVGPHRADWRISYAARAGREMLSRGQTKLTALACVLAQAREFAATRTHWPVIALDDLASELDVAHQRQLLDVLVTSDAQVLITGTEVPAALVGYAAPIAAFHVEHGGVRRQ